MPDIEKRHLDVFRRGSYLLLFALIVGLVTGVATWLFLSVEGGLIKMFWKERPSFLSGYDQDVVSLAVVSFFTLLAALIVKLSKGRPFDTGSAEADFDEHGRMDYSRLFTGLGFSLASLASGAAIGPEAPLTYFSGGISSWIADRMHASPGQVRTITYAGVAGALSAFFGAAPIGALFAFELVNPRSLSLDRKMIAAGLASGATAWTVYQALGGWGLPSLFAFPAYPAPRLVDLGMALVIGLAGAAVGLAYGALFRALRGRLASLRSRPWLAALSGGVPICIIAVVSPRLLFSGQAETPDMIVNAARLGTLVLIFLGLAKLALSAWSLSSAYFGGPIFPIIFAGTAFGLALSLQLPVIPQGVAVMSMIAGMTVASTAAPLSVTIFLSLLASPSLAPVIAIAAIAAYLLRQVIAPTLPGLYRPGQGPRSASMPDPVATPD